MRDRAPGPFSKGHPPGWLRPADLAGICTVCREPIRKGQEFKHPCGGGGGFSYSYSWESFTNPRNEPWVPGYRFVVDQPGIKQKRYNSGKMITRTYKVGFLIDWQGHLVHVSGPAPRPETLAWVEEVYFRERPGSNYYAGADDI